VFFSVTAVVSDDLGLILTHDVATGAQFYALKDIDAKGTGNIHARTPGMALPVAFTPGVPLAILGYTGMSEYTQKSGLTVVYLLP
jgi:hypothetical protein